jgi:hypothetical protein
LLGVRVYDKIQGKMESIGWNALRYGWDWPTARVLYPCLTTRHAAIRSEVVRRARAAGLTAAEWVEKIYPEDMVSCNESQVNGDVSS